MGSAKIETTDNRLLRCWRWSRQVAQAFHIGKKLNRILKLPRKATLTWQAKEGGTGLTLQDLKIHRALGLKLLEVDQDRSRKRSFKLFDYRLVSRYPRTKAISHLSQDVLRHFMGAEGNRNIPAQSRWLDMQDTLLHAKTGTIFSYRHSLSYTWIPEPRKDPEIAYEHSFQGRGMFRARYHPLKRIRAFLWTRRNYDLLVQAGIMKQN